MRTEEGHSHPHPPQVRSTLPQPALLRWPIIEVAGNMIVARFESFEGRLLSEKSLRPSLAVDTCQKVKVTRAWYFEVPGATSSDKANLLAKKIHQLGRSC